MFIKNQDNNNISQNVYLMAVKSGSEMIEF